MSNIFNGRIEVKKLGPSGTTALYGMTRNNGTTWHGGIDITCPDRPADSTAVYAAGDAADTQFEVLQSRIVNGGVGSGTAEWGNYVMLRGIATGLYYVFAHLASRSVSKGQRIAAGTQIGVMGNTGNAKGGYKHVHYEVRRTATGRGINPTPYLGIKNAVGIYGTKQEESDMPYFKIFTPRSEVVSSQQVHEGVLAQKQADGSLTGYFPAGDARMAREYTGDTISQVFEGIVKEMQPGEVVASVEK